MASASSSPPVVTRFAPSPTGFLHIGGARTALFNYLHARHCGGSYRLRIEDTDRKRSTPEAINAILDGLAWLGLSPDGETVYQSTRAERHREVAEDLLARGLAYRCYATPDELTEMRERARAEGRQPRYDGRWRDRDPAEAPAGVAPTIRLRSPQTGETIIEDAVQGRVVVQNKELDDLVLLRSDGTPTYMLAVIVDDADMGVTHVIRGDDHLNNAARQRQILDALGWTAPVYAHVPLIHGPDGAKLSKRHGALGIEAYREMGYLPEALRNYLLRLGWSHGDDELISDAEAIAWFDLDGLNKAPARIDFDKLASVNAHYLRALDGPALADRLAQAGLALSPAVRARFELVATGLAQRAQTLPELAEAAAFLAETRPIEITGKPAKSLDEEARARLARLAAALEAQNDWSREALETALHQFAEAEGVGFGKIGAPARAALTGGRASLSLSEILLALGKAESLARLADQTKPL